ncbi:MAG: hypothetical protein IT234_03285 [Bacteroidia bacterium]|nr:hypothetical protein [Bacteroidia bacterium]
MTQTFIRFFRNDKSKQPVKLNRRVITFLFCLLLSGFFWLLMTLSKDYTVSVSFPVKYVNVPADKVLSSELPEKIDMEISSRGFSLLFYKLRQITKTVSLDLKDARPLPVKNHYFLYTNNGVDKIRAQFANGIKVIKVQPDTIFLNYNKKITKRVPVKVDCDLTFADQYQLADSIQVNPSYITISGAVDVVEPVSFVIAQPLSMKGISKTEKVSVALYHDKKRGKIEYSTDKIELIIRVQKFTEASIGLPIEVENLPVGYSLKMFPDKVQVKYNVAFDNYEKINASGFRAVIDYKKIEEGDNKAKVQLVEYPKEIRAVKLNPEKVEYIIKK